MNVKTQVLICASVFFASSSHAAPSLPVPQFEGVFSYIDVAAGRAMSLPRETPEAAVKLRALGLGGGKTVMTWPSPACTRRFSARAVPKLVVRVASVNRDPHDFIQFYKVATKSNQRQLVVASAGGFGLGGAKSRMQEGAVQYDAAVVGPSAVTIVPTDALAPGEYVLSMADSPNSYCFGIDP